MEIAEYDGATLLHRYVPGHSVDQRVAWIDVSAGKTYYFHTNRLGSVQAVVDSSGSVTDQYVYTPFGVQEPLVSTGNPFRYTGRRYDPESDLYYYRARYYDAAVGQFLQPDLLGYQDQQNMYTYVGNDPLSWTDPSGMQAEDEVEYFEFKESRRVQSSSGYSHAGGFAGPNRAHQQESPTRERSLLEILNPNAAQYQEAYGNAASRKKTDGVHDSDSTVLADALASMDRNLNIATSVREFDPSINEGEAKALAVALGAPVAVTGTAAVASLAPAGTVGSVVYNARSIGGRLGDRLIQYMVRIPNSDLKSRVTTYGRGNKIVQRLKQEAVESGTEVPKPFIPPEVPPF